MQYEVPVIYKGQCTFIVDADTPDEAKAKAEFKFKNGDGVSEMGNEWETIDTICDPVEIENVMGCPKCGEETSQEEWPGYCPKCGH